jgi:hypothetical protein
MGKTPQGSCECVNVGYCRNPNLGSRPSQGLAKLWAQSEAHESYFMLPGVWESEGMNLHTLE